ncbi:MAG: TIGR00270 family protein [Thermoplasmata archaeon]|nr:TIGR00270 family protein [Thermoplasmata archaeon]
MAECEKCGKKAGRLSPVMIAGAEMYVCPDCTRFGTAIKRAPPPQQATAASSHSTPMWSSRKKDALSSREKELADDYPKRVQRARENKGWSREDLGRNINEKVSVISNLENGEIHPSDKFIKKLEKALGIELMEAVEEMHAIGSMESKGMTLADFIVHKNR